MMRFVFNYAGPEKRIYARGPNWWQITVPYGFGRFAIIRWWAA